MPLGQRIGRRLGIDGIRIAQHPVQADGQGRHQQNDGCQHRGAAPGPAGGGIGRVGHVVRQGQFQFAAGLFQGGLVEVAGGVFGLQFLQPLAGDGHVLRLAILIGEGAAAEQRGYQKAHGDEQHHRDQNPEKRHEDFVSSSFRSSRARARSASLPAGAGSRRRRRT